MDTTGSGSGLVPDQPGRERLRPDQPPGGPGSGGHPAPGRAMEGAADLPGREISGSDSRGGKFKSREP